METHRGVDERCNGRYYLHYRYGASTAEFWRYIAKPAPFEVQRGYVEVTMPGPEKEGVRCWMSSKKRWAVIVVLCVGAVSASRASFAQTTLKEKQRETLRRLMGVFIVVEDIHPDAEEDGLISSQVQTDVALTLRQAGIRLLTQKEWLTTPGSPLLYVHVSTFKDS